MGKNWIAVLSALLVAGACRAGGDTVKDKAAPTAFGSEVGCTLPPVPTEPGPGFCCRCAKDHPCLMRVKDWFCFTPLRTCPCECEHCGACSPPLYLYFLRPCVEGAPCYHYPDKCSSCVHPTVAATSGFGFCSRLFHSGCGCCDSGK
jgi:hypothetical protein